MRSAWGSLSPQLVAFAVALVTLTAAVLGRAFYTHARRQAHGELHERGRLIASGLALDAHRGVETAGASPALAALVSAAVRQPDVDAVRVLDARGRVLAAAARADAGGSGRARGAGETVSVGAEMRSGDRRVGSVEVILSLWRFHKTVRQAGGLCLAAVLGAAALGAAAALALGRRLALPLIDLAEAAARIRRGEYGVTVPVASGGELGELAEAFNAMSRELCETTACMEEVVESLDHPVVVASADGRIRRVNRIACAVTGHEPADLMGKPLSALFDGPPPAPLGPEAMERLLREGALRGQPATARLKAGGKLPVVVTASLVKDADGLPYALVLVGRTGLEE